MPPRAAPLLLQILRSSISPSEHDDPTAADVGDSNELHAVEQFGNTLNIGNGLGTFSADDWHELTTAAIRYRLAYQFSQWFKAAPERAARLPQDCFTRLQAVVRRTVMHNLAQQGHLRWIVSACAAANIPVLLLKGLWIGEIVYRDLAARSTGDVDLLLRHEDMPRFTALARELGCDVPHDAGSLCDLAPTSNEFPLAHPTHKTKFDIHWALTHPGEERPIDEARLWARAETFTIAGLPCRSLRVEDHLLLLCFHAANHHRFQYVGPRALLDVATAIASPPRPLDWDDLVARAREMGWASGAWLVFDLVREHLGVQPPQVAMDALRPANVGPEAIDALRPANAGQAAIDLGRLRQAALEAMFLDQAHQASLGINVVRVWDEKSWRRRAGMLFRLFFPPRESVAAQFQTPVGARGFHWLYVRRWVLLFRNHFGKFVDLARGRTARSAEFERARLINGWIER